ncbi:hypothetical protein [Planomonospora sp. ID82291]|uniref:hypothetical protein n=1 Tax=Planomonospora sp. ID82291 TaxID=2738136 RepID=UPI001E5A98FA|nr:hypothetical protein [Planomonospora sp. ID82291]
MQMEPRLPQLAAELPGVGLVEQDTTLGQQIDVERRRLLVLLIKRVEPLIDLRLQFITRTL